VPWVGLRAHAAPADLQAVRPGAAGARLLAGQADPALRGALTAALGALTAANGVTASADRANRRRFRANLGRFVADARSIVRTQ